MNKVKYFDGLSSEEVICSKLELMLGLVFNIRFNSELDYDVFVF